jgi:hypothetical protein
MRKQLFTLGLVAVVAIVLATPASAARGGATFTPIGLFPICTPETPPDEFCENFPLTTVTDMTGDGETIVGMHAFFSGAYIWTADTGLNTIGPVGGAPYLGRTNGMLSSSYFDDTFTYGRSAIWTGGFYPNQTWDRQPLVPGFSPCGGSGQAAFGGSDNFTVGLTWIDEDLNGNGCDGARAFAWSAGTGTYVLDDSVSGTGSYRANAVNTDGSVITGWSAPGRTASLWLNNVETYICDGIYSDWFCNEGWAVTPDGATILFTGQSPADFNVRAALYDVATGAIEQLPFPAVPGDPFWDSLQGWAISDDGNTVVGEFGGGGFFGSPPYPVLWNRDIGMTIDVQVFLLGQGLDDLFFWILEDATAVNSDGTIIAGSGVNPDGWIEAWKADISKVKICHKPEGQGVGNERTIAIGWESVPNHLGHGDFLSTCEFAEDGGSRVADLQSRRALTSNGVNADQDRRMRSAEEFKHLQSPITSNPFSSLEIESPFATATDDEASTDGQTEVQRDQLQRRIRANRQQ